MKNFILLGSLLLTLFVIGCGTTNSPAGGFIPDTYFDTKFTMLPGTGDSRLTQDLLVEPFVYPFVTVANFATFRFVWDHGDFPFSGFVHTLLDVYAVIPVYSHTDIRFKKLFGLGDTNTEVSHEVQHFNKQQP